MKIWHISFVFLSSIHLWMITKLNGDNDYICFYNYGQYKLPYHVIQFLTLHVNIRLAYAVRGKLMGNRN